MGQFYDVVTGDYFTISNDDGTQTDHGRISFADGSIRFNTQNGVFSSPAKVMRSAQTQLGLTPKGGGQNDQQLYIFPGSSAWAAPPTHTSGPFIVYAHIRKQYNGAKTDKRNAYTRNVAAFTTQYSQARDALAAERIAHAATKAALAAERAAHAATKAALDAEQVAYAASQTSMRENPTAARAAVADKTDLLRRPNVEHAPDGPNEADGVA